MMRNIFLFLMFYFCSFFSSCLVGQQQFFVLNSCTAELFGNQDEIKWDYTIDPRTVTLRNEATIRDELTIFTQIEYMHNFSFNGTIYTTPAWLYADSHMNIPRNEVKQITGKAYAGGGPREGFPYAGPRQNTYKFRAWCRKFTYQLIDGEWVFVSVSDYGPIWFSERINNNGGGGGGVGN